MAMTQAQKIAKLRMDVRLLKKTLGMLISWMAQSSVSPIRRDEASELLNVLDGNEP